ncbi:EamA family transporter RarD [Otariodibacter oris]|uniref:Chloramphenicol-sensitive protein RarD n=1 Tax=Otariodibacter oris TaxID=1032623 RepID=A0A420XHZ4_9PAST|nr:EamA family transporter RarD [Otariodibacter oris]QGM81047.1 permease [Otariodibacter oris]RKR76768.1 chloramphenicol-sensitive protein RarD [Otariodibacter oris]
MYKGIFFSVFASVLFGALYYLATFLKPLTGEDIFGFRMVVMLPFLWGAIVGFKQQKEFTAFLHRLKNEPHLILVLFLSASLVGVQMWLFLWAPNNGRAIDVSIGYLLMPIIMVAVGKFIYKEYLSLNKWLAIGFALVGVLSNIFLSGKLSWVSSLVMVGYPAYFMLRKRFDISHIHSFVLEVTLLCVVAIYFISQVDLVAVKSNNDNIYIYLFLLGLISGTALLAYTMASALVPFNLLGLLGYVEPLGLLLVSFIIGETLQPSAYMLMICLAIAIFFLGLDGVLLLRRKQRIKVE